MPFKLLQAIPAPAAVPAAASWPPQTLPQSCWTLQLLLPDLRNAPATLLQRCNCCFLDFNVLAIRCMLFFTTALWPAFGGPNFLV